MISTNNKEYLISTNNEEYQRVHHIFYGYHIPKYAFYPRKPHMQSKPIKLKISLADYYNLLKRIKFNYPRPYDKYNLHNRKRGV